MIVVISFHDHRGFIMEPLFRITNIIIVKKIVMLYTCIELKPVIDFETGWVQ